jgi:hypothetical protein
MNRRAYILLFLLIALPVQAHHTKEHVLGAPQTSVIAPNPQTTRPAGAFWLALGPFFVLAGLGAIRWGYRHQRERRMHDTRVKP